MFCHRMQLCNKREALRRQKIVSKRYCQQKMVDPNFKHYPFWDNSSSQERIIKNSKLEHINDSDSDETQEQEEDIYLSVITITLPFQNSTNNHNYSKKKTAYCFSANRSNNRMFTKKIQENYLENHLGSLPDDETSSIQTKYSDFVQHLDLPQICDKNCSEFKENYAKNSVEDESTFQLQINKSDNALEESSLSNDFKNDKHLSLITSHVQSPESEQIIRVVCNHLSDASLDASGLEGTSNNQYAKKKYKSTPQKLSFEKKYDYDVSEMKSRLENGVSLICKSLQLAPKRTVNTE